MQVKKVENASSHLKKIAALMDNWQTTVSNFAALTTELADEVFEFSKDDAYSNLIASKFKEAALLLSHQSDILNKGIEQSFLTPVQDNLMILSNHITRRTKWWPPKSDEVKQSKPIEDWYATRHDCFRLPFANLIGFQALYFQNLNNIWTSLTATLADKNLVGLSESATAKDIVATIETLVSNPLSLQYFKKFLEQDLAAENLNFILDVNAFMSRHKDNRTTFEDFSVHALKIYHRYISNRSDQQVNLDYDLSHSVSGKITDMTENLTRDESMFVDCRRSILNLLATSVLPRFRASPLCQELYMTWRPMRVPTEEVLKNAGGPRRRLSTKSTSLFSIFVPNVPSPISSSPPSSAASPVDILTTPPPDSSDSDPSAVPSSPPSPPPLVRPSTSPSPSTSSPLVRSSSSPGSAGEDPEQPVNFAQLSSQHRVRLVPGVGNALTPVFYQSRSSTISIPRKSVSSGNIVETSISPSSVSSSSSSPLRNTPEDALASRLKMQRRQTAAQIQSPFSIQAYEQIFSDPDKEKELEKSLFGSSLGSEPSYLSPRTFHTRPRAITTQYNTNGLGSSAPSASAPIAMRVVGRRSRHVHAHANNPHSSSLVKSDDGIPRNSYEDESDGSDNFASAQRSGTSRGNSSDSLQSVESAGELVDRERSAVSRNSSFESLEMALEKSSNGTRRIHRRSISYDSGLAWNTEKGILIDVEMDGLSTVHEEGDITEELNAAV